MAKTYLKLQRSEGFVIQAAAQIYAAYIAAGRATEEQQDQFMKKAIGDAIQIAKSVDEAIVADDEVG